MMKSQTAVIIALFLLMSGCCSRTIAKKDAELMATQEISDYCKTEGLPDNSFRVTGVTASETYPWIFDYQAIKTPNHLVRIYIDKCGQREIHRSRE